MKIDFCGQNQNVFLFSRCVSILFAYLTEVQKKKVDFIKKVEVYDGSNFMNLECGAISNLELFETIRTKQKKGSLIWILDKTKTAMGKRLLRSWIERPLLNIDIINKTMFKNNESYRIYQFTNNDKKLQELINDDIGLKIYILDIELENISGIDIARKIRSKDNDSIIIISTTYVEYLPFALKNKLMLFDFVSKFEDYEVNLSNVINNAIKQLQEQ